MQNNTDTCSNNTNNNTQLIVQTLTLFFSVISTAIGAFGAFQWRKMTAHKTTSAEDTISLKCDKLKLSNEKMGFETEGLEVHIQEKDSGSKSISKQSAKVVAKTNIRQESLLFTTHDEGSKTQSLSSPTFPEKMVRLDTQITEQENGTTRQGPADTQIVRDSLGAITNLLTGILYSAGMGAVESNQPISHANKDLLPPAPATTPISPQSFANTVAYASPPLDNNHAPKGDGARYGYSYPSHMSLSAVSDDTVGAISRHTTAVNIDETNEPYASPSLAGEHVDHE